MQRSLAALGPAAGGKQKPSAAADAPIDLSFLKGLDANADIQADKLGYGKLFAGPVATSLTVADGKAHLNVPQSRFYGGTIGAEMTADGSGDAASLDLNTAITGAAAAPLLDDAADFDHIEGTLDATVAVSGSGKTTKSLARSLRGKAATKFSDGAFRGIDIAEVYNNLVGLLAGGFKQDQAKKTDIHRTRRLVRDRQRRRADDGHQPAGPAGADGRRGQDRPRRPDPRHASQPPRRRFACRAGRRRRREGHRGADRGPGSALRAPCLSGCERVGPRTRRARWVC
ncbi:AsmA family protein [Mesorhizobium atlanticum]